MRSVKVLLLVDTSFREVVISLCMTVASIAWMTGTSIAQQPFIEARDGSGVFGYKDTPIQPWSGFHTHDPDRPAPPKITPGEPAAFEHSRSAPSDAIILFNGSDLSPWEPSSWKIEDGTLIATKGVLLTKRKFGDCQLHLEWQAPVGREENIMNQGNNGIRFLDCIEVQVFDSYTTKIYPDGQAASIYAQTPPLVNACREPGQWETYDIVFVAPQFDVSGTVVKPARLTMCHNGLLVHHNQEIFGDSPHKGLASYKRIKSPAGQIGLMAHSCPVKFRNIWVRNLPILQPSNDKP